MRLNVISSHDSWLHSTWQEPHRIMGSTRESHDSWLKPVPRRTVLVLRRAARAEAMSQTRVTEGRNHMFRASPGE